MITDLIRWLHIVGATVLLGTGAGIAFFMVMAQPGRDPRLIAHVAHTVVVADLVFTLPAVIAQPLTGLALARATGWPLSEGWIVASVALYIVTGGFWLPVVWMQIRMRDLARAAARDGQPLPAVYDKLFRAWLACGVPAFAAVLAILWLMAARPHVAWP